MATQIRKDYILDRWVIVASERVKRPTDFAPRIREVSRRGTCPFCPGNEKMTPPASLIYIPSNGGIKRDKDSNGERTSNWLVRCVPNLYPALTPRKPLPLTGNEFHEIRDGIGAHEVIIESPTHDEHPHLASIKQLQLVLQAYLDRLREFSIWEYASIFRNHGKEAGASLSHAHSQIIATPMVPKLIAEELSACKNLYLKNNVCPFCKIIEIEHESPRFIYENRGFMAFTPWASVYPFEFWILPKKHQHTLLQMKEIKDFAEALKKCLGSLARALNDPPYSYGFHIAPFKGNHEYFHWHLEVYPKLTIQAGFENSTGMFINIIPPESAAETLRNSIE